VSFPRKYILFLLLPPAPVTASLSFIFLTQVMRMSWATSWSVFGLFALFFLVGAVVTSTVLRPVAEEVDNAVRYGRDVSQPASLLMERTENLALLLWGVGSVLYAVFGALLVMPTALGFTYFLVSALIAAFPSIIWAYAGGKHLILKETTGAAALRYVGREFPLGRKIAIVFIGTVLIAFAALVTLISSKVSLALEQLALASSADRFQRIVDTANLAGTIDKDLIDNLRVYVPPDYTLHLLTRSGQVHSSSKDTLTPDEVARVRTIVSGDSSSFVSPHVMKFARLKDGSILRWLSRGSPTKTFRGGSRSTRRWLRC